MSKIKPKLSAPQAAYKIFDIARSNRLDMMGIMFDGKKGDGGMVNHIPNAEHIPVVFIRFIASFLQELVKRLGCTEGEARGYILEMTEFALSDGVQQKTNVQHIVDPEGPECLEPLAE